MTYLGSGATALLWLGPQTTATAGTLRTGASTMNLVFTSPLHSPSSSIIRRDLTVRCDRIRTGAGCVHPGFAPSVGFSVSGAAADVAVHIYSAQQSGLPGRYGSAPLNYLGNSTLSDQNGRTACPNDWTRPSGKTCDEYPFKSTYQGASTGGGSGRTFSWCNVPLPTGVTGPTGFSSCMVPAGSNSSQGGTLGAFYTANRILDGDAFYAN